VNAISTGRAALLSQAKQLKIAAIRFLNPAPLMWDFEHEPQKSRLAKRYSIEWMMPAQCAERLALPADHPDAADIGLVPIAALATTPGLKVIPGCAIASKGKIRSLLLVRRTNQPLTDILTVAADTSSRATLAYTQVLFHLWQNPFADFYQHRPDLDSMLAEHDAAILIGDPALFALEDREQREARTGEKLVYHDLAEEWIKLMGVPWISAVWVIRESSLQASGRTMDEIAADFTQSRDHGLADIESLVKEWSAKLPIPAETIRTYLTRNIFYKLDEECQNGLKVFYKLAARYKILPKFHIESP
jgi:chorismate dehydratase